MQNSAVRSEYLYSAFRLSVVCEIEDRDARYGVCLCVDPEEQLIR